MPFSFAIILVWQWSWRSRPCHAAQGTMLLTSDKVVDTAFLVRFRRPSLRMWSWWRRWRLWSASWMACHQHSRSQRWV